LRLRAGAAADINLLVGSNTGETRLFLHGTIDRITEEALAGIARAYGLSAEGLSGYRVAHSGASADDLFSAIQLEHRQNGEFDHRGVHFIWSLLLGPMPAPRKNSRTAH
jgi:hypothetical protein